MHVHASVMAVPEEFGGFLQVSGVTFDICMDVDSPVILDENGMFAGIVGEEYAQPYGQGRIIAIE